MRVLFFIAMKSHIALTTRAPEPLWQYVAFVARHPRLGFRTTINLLSAMALEFIREKPWEQGMTLDAPRATFTRIDGVEIPTG